MNEIKKLPPVIEEYFNKNDFRKHTHYDELFNAQKDNIDLQSQVSERELRAIAVLRTNDKYLNEKIKISEIYEIYIQNFLRLKVSLERQSRKEYVEVNKNDQTENQLRLMQGLNNPIMGAKRI